MGDDPVRKPGQQSPLPQTVTGREAPLGVASVDEQQRATASTYRLITDGADPAQALKILLGNPKSSVAASALLNLAHRGRPEDMVLLEDLAALSWEGFDAGDWQGTLELALERMSGRYQFRRGADLEFTTDLPRIADLPIQSPRQWAAGIWHEVHHLTGLDKGITRRSLFTLLLKGEEGLFERFRENGRRYAEPGEDQSLVQKHALNHLLLAAASQKLTDTRRAVVLEGVRIIDTSDFKGETRYRHSLREVVDDIILFLGRPPVNPMIERDVAIEIEGVRYAPRRADGAGGGHNVVLYLLRPLMDQSYTAQAARARSLNDLAANYGTERSAAISGCGRSPEAPAVTGPSAALAPAVVQAQQAGAMMMTRPQAGTPSILLWNPSALSLPLTNIVQLGKAL